ncbi:tRNA glutamyl-Q(34) synthetase GluQRS [Thalassobius sp. Cn5-15]|uniref:tRNA glutamyl-Q(34) synthetase GluQRS n=1 Tax=Thalassobius sp. Cn5-15 TaxID=2917763 RepID=UPI001EF1DDF6|nr:tRNA glutamyl-Q(34) synthetase GluQRS [Thalassobius sp. Cn5-15]MCG7492103.1 tRNA glutamyl-Q(34) synthetase GluQRS [Thalassobius sp. Cn5-15]
MPFVTRFAPSPTGPLHLGHAYSALLAHDMARAAGGRFLLRIEDIDRTRARAQWEDQIYEDIRWLGLTWDAAPLRQSDRLPAYHAALERLWERGLLYACDCTRRDIQSALTAPQEGGDPAFGPDGLIYPGTCRNKPRPEKMPESAALRLDMARAIATLNTDTISYEETGAHPQTVITPTPDLISTVGDIILSRRDFLGSYHLSVILDDAHQNITHVVRGQDISEATQIHVLLQQLLGLPTPCYHHHRLIRDATGKRLAKRDDARAIAKYRADGASPADIRRMVGL